MFIFEKDKRVFKTLFSPSIAILFSKFLVVEKSTRNKQRENKRNKLVKEIKTQNE